MPEYSYKDVIIDPEDPRVEIGAEYYFASYPRECLHRAIEGIFLAKYVHAYTEGTYDSFLMNWAGSMISAACLIRKKEPKKKYVPFDLSKPEARNSLRGKYLVQLHVGNFAPEERLVVGFSENSAVIGGCKPECHNGHELLENFTFLDGTPCGEEVEE